jgi:hypothetical protein
MRPKRKSGRSGKSRMPWQRAGVVSLALVCALGCSKYPTLKSQNPTVDCTIENAYDFDTTRIIDGTMTYGSGDPLGNPVLNPTVQPIPEGSLCDSANAINFQAADYNDWGDLFGFYGFGPRDESAYAGMSFWARAPGASNKSFTISLDDANTFASDGTVMVNCKNYNVDGGTLGPTQPAVDPMTGIPISGTTNNAPPADACGNSYTTPVTVTTDWRFYTIPFDKFLQSAMPSRVPNAKLMEVGAVPGTGLLTNKIMGLVFRMPKASTTDLWFAKMTFYRNKTGGTSGDGGADAPRM